MTTQTPLSMTEGAFRQQVLDLARLTGWRCYFTWASLHSPAGFPDLCLVRRGRLVFAELKSERGKATPEQQGWLIDVANAAAESYLWRPGDWPEVEKVLR
jgi:hypothetical protein